MNLKMSWIVLGCFAAAACGGGGGGTGSTTEESTGGATTDDSGSAKVQGLDLPEKFTALSAADDSSSSTSGKTSFGASKASSGTQSFGTSFTTKTYDEAGTPYSQDEADVYVYDASMESLNMINEIVCYLSQTAASQMVNEGPYIALVNEERCLQGQNGGGDTGQTGQSSGGEATQFARWVIDAERTDNESPQTVKAWVPDPGGGGEGGLGQQHILVEITASEARSDSKPFGSFVMNFKGVADGTDLGLGSEVETMRGLLATVENDASKPEFRFVNLGGTALESGLEMPFGFEQAANVRLDDAEGTSGLAVTNVEESWTDEMSGEQGSMQRAFAIAYDETRFASSRDENGDGSGEELVCRARDEFDTRVWRYGLYHREDGEFRGRSVTGGDRVELNSGFPFEYDSDADGVSDAHGWVGYHGVWTETDELLPDGATIARHDYETDQSTDYTVRVAPGRLTRRTAHEDTLATFVGDEFEFWGEHPTLGYGDWLVTLSQELDFVVTAAVEWGAEGPTYHETIDHDDDPNTAKVDVNATLTLVDQQVLRMWSSSLGGNVVYSHDTSVLAEQRKLKYYAEAYVSSTDPTLFPSGTLEDKLYCYEQCIKGGLTQAEVDAAASTEDLYRVYEGQPFTYTISLDNGRVVLTDDANGETVDASALSLAGLDQEWGVNTGEMVTEQLADPAAPWTVYEQPVSYRWETGPNSWNQMIAVTDASGNAVEFDRPLEMDYVHSIANDANGSSEYDGKRFLLHYSGFGELGGFPWREEAESTDRWYPAVTLADGALLSEGDNDFVVKALEKEQSMTAVTSDQCNALDAEAVYSDSSLSLPDANEIGTVSFTFADRPVVDAAPAVVEGEVQ